MLRLTAAESEASAQQLAAGLTARGVHQGDRIAISLPQVAVAREEAAHQQAAILGLVLGALRVGIVPVMINPALPAIAQSEIAADSQPSIVIDSTASIAELRDAAFGAPIPELSPVPLSRPMHYTSGTTGRSKGVWTGVLSGADAAALWGEEQEQWTFYPDDVTLVHGPFAHSAPLRFAMLVLLAGGSVLLDGPFNVERVASALVTERPTHAFLVPSHVQRLLALPGGPPPSPYRQVIHAGAACPAPLKRALHRWVGVEQTWELYGSTEGQFTACQGTEWEQHPGTVGRARRGRKLLIDDGVIWCTTPPWAHFEYWNDQEKTRSAWRSTASGQAFSVGDLGRLDDDGYLHIEGRRADLIITGGVNVYPVHVESVLDEHPGVVETAVFGVDDPRWGQRVCAAIVGDVDPTALSEWARTRLAGYQRPKNYYFVDSLPYTATGKVKRTTLPELLNLNPSQAPRAVSR